MNKTIEEWRIDLYSKLEKSVEEAMKTIINCHEEILIAFCAKYKIPPNEIVVCYEGNKFWVEKRSDNHIEKTPMVELNLESLCVSKSESSNETKRS